jgi:hypothetical protein
MMEVAEFELLSEDVFYAPVASDAIDTLMGQYQAMRAKVDQVGELFAEGPMQSVIGHFIDGNKDDGSYSSLSAEKIFRLPGAIGSLNATFWKRVIDLTYVYDCMPQKRRDEWNNQMRHPLGIVKGRQSKGDTFEYNVQPLPDFEENTVRATIGDLLLSRAKFFGERVDGIFRALSSDHVTNCPEGFSKRMIMNWC